MSSTRLSCIKKYCNEYCHSKTFQAVQAGHVVQSHGRTCKAAGVFPVSLMQMHNNNGSQGSLPPVRTASISLSQIQSPIACFPSPSRLLSLFAAQGPNLKSCSQVCLACDLLIRMLPWDTRVLIFSWGGKPRTYFI